MAERLARTFLDFDQEIERREGKTIADIFGEKGEGHFRELERALTEELRLDGQHDSRAGWWMGSRTPTWCACSGRPRDSSTFGCDQKRRSSVWAPSEALGRCLMRPDPLGEIRRLLDARKAAYESADHVIEAELLGVEDGYQESFVARAGHALIRSHCGQSAWE